jgi:putative phage-type endonuclease
VSEIIQGSPEWFAIRLGKVTASRVADVVAKTKSGFSTSRANYMAELIAERLTGETAPSFTNAAMQWGTEKEPDARAAYEFRTDSEVAQVGFIIHPQIADSGASPDGLVGADGMAEFKCPNTATHIETLLTKAVPGKYVTQMQWQMACAGRKWCDFVSFDPRMPEAMRLFIQRIERDDKVIADLEKDVLAFLDEMAKKIAQLIALNEKTKEAA